GLDQLPDAGADFAEADVIAFVRAHHHQFIADLGGEPIALLTHQHSKVPKLGDHRQARPEPRPAAMSHMQPAREIMMRRLERAKGFEPSTPTLARSCSTPELHPQNQALRLVSRTPESRRGKYCGHAARRNRNKRIQRPSGADLAHAARAFNVKADDGHGTPRVTLINQAARDLARNPAWAFALPYPGA